MNDATSTSVIAGDMIAVTGATGYVGGWLVPALLEAGYRVRCLVREPRKLDARPWRHLPNVEVIAGDLADTAATANALHGCRAAYYLVHSMAATGGTYADRDRELAAGSASFEILRYLVERLPIMVTPKWETTECQPVAIADVIDWLVRCLEEPETAGKMLEIGGPDVMPYRGLMRVMAEELGLPRRIILPVPVLTPRLSSLWINLVTPVSYRIARPLAEGLKNRVIVTDDTAQRLMPARSRA